MTALATWKKKWQKSSGVRMRFFNGATPPAPNEDIFNQKARR